ncbi:hypothetical protein [Sphingomonas panni]|uniref:hypothetical protein n=1 Tax=Sphingomonas panni TaxID=237612 RepID=UPI001F5B338F|nr:hypothetical protein [Sphingomonas panni]
MYSESDLNGAVEAGVLSHDAADALRAHIARQRATPVVDEEHFRLLTGFNDIFVSVALALLLVSLAWIGGTILTPLGGLGVAGASWFLAEYFTARRRMALPSILLLLAFVGGVAATLFGIVVEIDPQNVPDRTTAMIFAGIGIVAAGSAWAHWRRFMVPITVAAGAAALVVTVAALLVAAFPALKDNFYPVTLLGGVGVFAAAMRWDLSDRDRRTRRSDVAFWLHLVAAPLVAHSLFQLLGVFGPTVTAPMAAVVIALYVAFGVVALAVDRRALLVSSLAYVLYALYALFQQAGAVELSAAFTAFVIGSALLTLSVFWQPMRRQVVGLLGGMGERLPPVAMA